MKLISNCNLFTITIAKITQEELTAIQAKENIAEYIKENIFKYNVIAFFEGIETDCETITFNDTQMAVAFEQIKSISITDDGFYLVNIRKENAVLDIDVIDNFNPANVIIKYVGFILPEIIGNINIATGFYYPNEQFNYGTKAILSSNDVSIIQKSGEEFTLIPQE